MYQTFDILQFIRYLRRRWSVIVVACSVALAISLCIGQFTTKRYSATASIMIEPPGGSDARVATAVSAVYLESLRSYERFASSDTLFARAVERFDLQNGSRRSIEELKQQVLKVSKLRDTKILEISVTLPDPRLAQRVVQYLAEQTVDGSQKESQAADEERIEAARKESDDARLRLSQARQAWTRCIAQEPVDLLQTEIEADSELAVDVRKQLMEAQSEAVEYQDRTELFAREAASGARARAVLLEQRSNELSRRIDEMGNTVSKRAADRERLQAELKSAQSASDVADARLRDLRAATGMRGEWLRVIDPGIVPQRPSSPNIPLDVIAAVFLALVLSFAYLSLAFVYWRNAMEYDAAIPRRRRSA